MSTTDDNETYFPECSSCRDGRHFAIIDGRCKCCGETVEVTLDERIDLLIETGIVTFDDDEVTDECARRYVDAEHRRRNRNASRDVERSAKVRQESNARLRDRVSGIVAEMSADLLAEWDASLLASSFATGDGARVTWQEATVEQHIERAERLEGMAAGDLQTASIHRQAVHDIEVLGVSTLAGVSGGR